MKKFAAFDIDGTLIRWQLYHAVVDKLAKQGLLGEKAHQQLHDARMVWKRREHREAFHAYEKELITVYEHALPNIGEEQFMYCVRAVADEYKTQVYTFTRDLAKKLKQQNYTLIAISGSHREIVEPVARQYGFDIFLGTEYERRNGRFTGKVKIGSKDKHIKLKQLINTHNLDTKGSYGVGDSKSDASMLELVDNPIAFNPDRELFAIAQDHGWPIVIERKNMVYRLEREDGRYVLA